MLALPNRPLHALRWLPLCALALLLGASCDRPPTAATGPEKPAELGPPSLTLMVLTDPRGYLEPCGCQQRPLGGVDKLATTVQKVRAEGRPVLLLAAGNLFFGAELHGEDVAEARTQERWKAETLAGIWKDLGMTAVAPGPLDFSHGSEVASGLRAQGGFPWLSQNLKGAEPPLNEATLLEVDGHTIGLLASHAESRVPPWPEPLSPSEPSKLADAVAALREKGAELVVGLHVGDRRSARTLSRAGADLVILGGLDERKAIPPVAAGDAHVLHAGRQGQQVVRVDVSLRGEGPLKNASPWTVQEKKQRLRKDARSLAEKIAEWEDDPEVNPDDLATQKARLQSLRARAEALSQPTPDGRWFAAQKIELDPDVPGDETIAARMDAYDARVNQHNRVALADREPEPAPEGEPSYVGSQACGGCHAPAVRWWEETAHGNAYATLEELHKEFNLSCVGCHVTGYNEPGGSTVTHVKGLKNVGCESCHGPGSQHVQNPQAEGRIALEVPERVCAECHTPDHSARFEYETFKPLMIAPGHGMPVKGGSDKSAKEATP